MDSDILIPGLGISMDDFDVIQDEFFPIHFPNKSKEGPNNFWQGKDACIDIVSEACAAESAAWEMNEENSLEEAEKQFFKLESAPPRHIKKKRYRNRTFQRHYRW